MSCMQVMIVLAQAVQLHLSLQMLLQKHDNSVPVLVLEHLDADIFNNG